MACYWIGVVSRDHVQAGVRGGFAQLGHGKAAPVRRLARGDWLVYYSPRTAYPDGPALQAFTAIGEVIDDAPEQVAQTPGFHPYRRRVRFLEANEAPIAPLLDSLSFTRDKTNWGFHSDVAISRFRRTTSYLSSVLCKPPNSISEGGRFPERHLTRMCMFASHSVSVRGTPRGRPLCRNIGMAVRQGSALPARRGSIIEA